MTVTFVRQIFFAPFGAPNFGGGESQQIMRIALLRLGTTTSIQLEWTGGTDGWIETRLPAGCASREDGNRLSVKAYFQSLGIFGKIYWYMFLPFHVFIFRDLIKMIERRSVDGGLGRQVSSQTSPA